MESVSNTIRVLRRKGSDIVFSKLDMEEMHWRHLHPRRFRFQLNERKYHEGSSKNSILERE